MVGKLIPLLVAGGIGLHSSDALKEKFQDAIGLTGSYVTKQRMGTILRTARLHIVSGDDWTVRNDRQLRDWIRKNIRIENSDTADPSLDSWGTPFRQSSNREGVALISAGPDKTFGTKDDLRVWSDIYNY